MEPSSGGLIGTGQLVSHEIWLCMRREGWGRGNNRNCLGTRFVLRCNCFQNSYVKLPKLSEFSYCAFVHCVSAYFYCLSLFTILNWFGLSCFSPRIYQLSVLRQLLT
jgi:hypothetical protein